MFSLSTVLLLVMRPIDARAVHPAPLVRVVERELDGLKADSHRLQNGKN